jgi:uncharacterized protein (TIGR00725 family)
MTKRLKSVSIIGGATCSAEESELAEKVGSLLATNGVVVVTGGRCGVMEAASRGATKAGGVTVGILPGSEHDAGNDYLSVAIPTGLGHVRNALVAQAGEAVIAIGGSYGTLSEISIALRLGRTVIGLGTWKAMDGSKQEMDIVVAQSADEAVNLALRVLAK